MVGMTKYSPISQYESLAIEPKILEVILFAVNCKDCLSAELVIHDNLLDPHESALKTTSQLFQPFLH